jgi:hypothetical protein
MSGGVFPAVTFVFTKHSTWLIWGTLVVLIFVLSPGLALHRLIIPALPLVLWIVIYVLWGSLSAPYPIFENGRRLTFRFVTIIAAMTVVTSHPRRLSFYASSLQWVLVGNLIVTAWLIQNPQYQDLELFARMDTAIGSDRFAGLWGDANLAGLATLFILVLSYWARPWIGWVGRVSGALIVYLTASRTAFWIAVVLGLLYLAFAADGRSRVRAILVGALLVLGGAGYLNFSHQKNLALTQGNNTLSRVFDLSESKVRDEGGGSRLDLAKDWLAIAARGPWYGYGLFSFEGDNSTATLTKRGFPDQGTHNTYLAIFIDTGWVGLGLFLIILITQLVRTWRTPLSPQVHQMLFALNFVFLVFSLANHQMVTDYLGWMGFSLIFLLPRSRAAMESEA